MGKGTFLGDLLTSDWDSVQAVTFWGVLKISFVPQDWVLQTEKVMIFGVTQGPALTGFLRGPN